MAAGGRHFERTFHALLSAHVGKVEVGGVLLLVKLAPGVYHGGLEGLGAVEQCYHIVDRLQTIDVEIVHHSRFPLIGLGHNETLELLLAGPDGHGKRTPDGDEPAVETQFAGQHKPAQPLALYLAVGGHNADGQRQVVAAALFAYVGGRHVDGDVGHGHLVAVVLQGGTYAVVALAHRGVGQSGEMEQHTACDAYLYHDGDGFKAHHGGAVGLDKHFISTVGQIFPVGWPS